MATGASFNYFKSSSLMPSLIKEFKFSYGLGGLFSGMFGIPVLTLSIPAGFLLPRLNLRGAITLTSSLSIIGSLIVSLTQETSLLFLGRFLEGTGMALALVISPYLISRFLTEEHVALGMGLLMLFNPLGNILGMTICPFLLSIFGWRAAWLSGIFLPATAPIFLLKLNQTVHKVSISMKSYSKYLKERNLHLLGLLQLGLTFSSMGFLMWMPTYLNEIHMLDIKFASFISSLFMVIGIPTPLLASLLVKKIKSRKKFLVICFAASSILFPVSTLISGPLLLLHIIFLGLFAGLLPTIINLCMSELLGPLSSMGFGLLNLQRGFSMFFGPMVMGVIRDVTDSWDLSFSTLSIFTIMSIAAALLMHEPLTKHDRN
ncbi:MAG: MFS transporter [Candidatus Bathyarchaeia archaeon]